MSIILWMEMQGSGERVRWGMGAWVNSSCGSLVVSSDFLSPSIECSTHDGGRSTPSDGGWFRWSTARL